MDLPKIDTFLDLVATVLVGVTVVFSVLALFGLARAVRLGAILLVTALALYSDAFGTYFAAIFIVATAVTELEFLEKLAAIIRGSKEYFDYKKSQVPVEEAKAKAGADAAAAVAPEAAVGGPKGDGLPPEPQPPGQEIPQPPVDAAPPRQLLPSGDAASVGYAIEQLALTYFERRLGVPIQRNIRYSTSRAEVEVDGVIEKGMGKSDTHLEVKLASGHNLADRAFRSAKEFLRREETFKEMTGRRTTGILVVVVPDKRGLEERIASVKTAVQSLSHTLQLEVVDFKDIGYSSE